MALTGTEAVSNGVPAFKPPEARNAQIVLVLMAAFFGIIFLGISFLSAQLGILPDPTEQETVLSQLTATLVGAGSPYHYLVQLSTAVLLVLAANTAFADFPRLSSILARDGFLPRVFQFRGERLAFNSGIIVLALVAAVLLVAFGGCVTALIPLYTVGVFMAFTLSQSGMVRHWFRLREDEPGWRRRSLINGIGALTTGVVAIEVAATKFIYGAWVVAILIPLLIAMMLFIKRQYSSTAEQLAVRRGRPTARSAPRRARDRAGAGHQPRRRSGDQRRPVDRRRRAGRARQRRPRRGVARPRALGGRSCPTFRWSSSSRPTARWSTRCSPTSTCSTRSWPADREAPITFVVIPEFVARHWWERILYNQSANRLRRALLGRPHTVVVNVPYRRETNGADVSSHQLSPCRR